MPVSKYHKLRCAKEMCEWGAYFILNFKNMKAMKCRRKEALNCVSLQPLMASLSSCFYNNIYSPEISLY